MKSCEASSKNCASTNSGPLCNIEYSAQSTGRLQNGGLLMIDMLNFLFPNRCLGCEQLLQAGASHWCNSCFATLEPNGRTVEPAAPLHAAWAPFLHGGALADALYRFKYQGRSDLARPLGIMLANAASKWVNASTTIVPVPLHQLRFRERGFDQTTLLSAVLAKQLDQPFAPHWLHRIRNTPRQVELDETQRQQNVAGAFSSVKAYGPVCLVDDVYTTGATARSAAQALLDAGASSVIALTLSYALRIDSTSRRHPKETA